MDSRNLRRVKEAWRTMEQEGVIPGWQALLEICDPNCVFAPPSGGGRVFEGVAEWQAFLDEEFGAGGSMEASPYHFVERGDAIEVLGAVRITRANGSLADSQGRWTYRFEGERIVEMTFEPE